jgi:hypothetical protein
MKQSGRRARGAKAKAVTPRRLVDDLMEGVAAMAAHRAGKSTLRTHTLEVALPPDSRGPVDGGL